MKKAKRYFFRNIISWILILSMMFQTMQTPEFALVVRAEEPEEPEYSEEPENSEETEDPEEPENFEETEDPEEPENFEETELGQPQTDILNSDGSGQTQADVSYLDENGQEQTCALANVLSGNEASLDPGWYVVNSDIVFHNSVILDTSGAYHIILADGGKMSIVGDKDEYDDWSAYSNGESPVGLGCLYDDDRKNGIDLSIYAQSAGTGELYIYNGSGSSEDRTKVGDAINVDELTINGGKITCNTEGSKSYGISTKNLTINDGTVNATANGTDGSGIKADASITINDGEVIAEALNGDNLDDNYGIRSDGQITINGGRVSAKGSKAGIYSGNDETPLLLSWEKETDYFSANSFSLPNADVAIRPGKTFTDGNGHYYVAANASEVKSMEDVTLFADTSTLVSTENINDSLGEKILPADSFNVCVVTFDSNGGTPVKAQTLAMGELATMPATPIKRGYKFVGWYTDRCFDEPYKFDFTSRPVDTDLVLYAKWVEVGPISYIGADGQISGFKAYSLMQEDYTELPAGSYYVDQTITLPDRIKVTGEVNLILGDGYTLTVPWGISVMGDNTLNIFCQSGGTGRLIANAASENAAIGGDSTGDSPNGSSGNISIYGGYIDARGGTDAASIGGGKNNQNYGTIRIYGGTINSLSGKYAAAIGGGQISATKNAEKVTDGTIEIYGGTVTVSANAEGTGIGGGKHSYGGDISILGGKVTVTVSPNNAENDPYSGIGDGYLYKGPEKARITLGCGNADDFIYAEQYYGNVRVASYQTLQIADDDSTKFYGEISDPNGMIRKKTLKLSHTHELTFSANGSTITASCSDSGCELHINPAVLTLHAPSEDDIVYDGNEWPAIVTDDQGIRSYAPVYYQKKDGNAWGEKVTAAPEAVGTYLASITLSDGKTHSTATVSVEYTIIKREVTISGLTADDKVYDDSTTVKINDTAIKLEGKVDGDDVHIVSGNASFDSADAGTGKTVTFRGYSLSGTAAGNYNLLSQPASVTADIEKRPVSIKADDQTVQLGEAIAEMAVSWEQEQGTDKGICSGHVLKKIVLTPDPDPCFVLNPVKNGTITAGGAVIMRGAADVTGNYEISYQPGSLEITLHRASVTKLPAAGVDLKYQGFGKEQWLLVYPGEADTKMEYQVQQISRGNGELLENGDGSLVLNNEAPTDGYGDAFSAWEAGSYHVFYRAASANDLLPSEPECISVNIATAPLTIRVPDASISYGDEFPDLTPVVNGFVTPEEHQHIGTVKLEYLSGGEWKNATEAAIQGTCPETGTYPLTASYTGNGEVNSCYTVTSVSGNLTVEPRIVSLNWGETKFTYNGKPQVPTVTLSNLAKNEDPAAVTVCVAGQQVNAGQDYIATAAALSGNKAANYRLPSDNTKAFSIAKAGYPRDIPTIKIEVPDSANTFTVSVAGKLSADAGKLTYPGILSLSTNGFEHIEGGIDVNVDENGLATVSINRDIQNNITAGTSISFRANVDSTNYDRRTVDVDAFFVEKYDAGVRITSGNAVSVSYDQVPGLTLGAVTTCENAGSNGTWTWESSHPEVAAVQGGNQRDDGNCDFIIKSVGTSRISVKYESSTATGYADLILTVNPVYVSVPEVTKELNYTGSYQMCMGNYDNKIFSVSGASASMPGEYVVTIALNDTDKYRWEDGTSEEKSISWRINKMNGPAAPTGITGIAPTTGDNIDGKISGVKNTMEYSTNEYFTGAIRCTNGDIIGLTPGDYYVRVRETDTAKAGAAVKVEVKACPVPVVKARQGLTYNGSSQVLAESDKASNGKLYYAVVKKGDPEPAGKEYALSSPTATNAGSYYVWYKASLNDKASCIESAIGKKGARVKLSAADKIYDGSTEAKLAITVDGVCAGDSIVITGVSGNFADKNVGGAKNVSIDSSRKIIIGAENYDLFDIPGSTLASISKRDLSMNDGAVVIQPIPVQYYTGSEVRPKPVVKCYGTTLKEGEGEDYTLSYGNNTEMGTATVTVTGKNNCVGTITRNFEIGLPAFGTVTVAGPADINYGDALGAAPTVTAKDEADQNIDLTGETITLYYSASSAGSGIVWDPSKVDLNAGTYYVWAEVAEKKGEGGHAAVKSALVSFKVNKVAYDTPSQNILPDQDASYEVTVALPAGAKNTEYEYAITTDTAGQPAADTNAWSVLPALTNGKFTATALNAGGDYKIWLRRKADANHSASAAIYKPFSTPATVMLSYDLNGGSGTVPEAMSYEAFSMADTIDPGLDISRYGYTFRTWNTQADGTGTDVAPGKTDFTINATTVLYAQWMANQYTVVYDANGGRGSMADQVCMYGTALNLRKNTFSRDGYRFAGWATSAGGDVVYKDGQNVKDLASKGKITLYAVWTDLYWSVSGNVSEGEGEDMTAVQSIKVQLKRGNTEFGTEQVTDIEGRYSFNGVPAGIYNLVATRDLGNGKKQTVTKLVEITSGQASVNAIVMPDENINSEIDVKDDTPDVMVGGLDAVAAENAEEGREVTVTMTVETKSEADAEGAEEIRQLAEESSEDGREVEIDFLDISIGKKIGEQDVVEPVTETSAVVELIIPLNFAGKKNLRMLRFHEGEAEVFQKLGSRPANPADGTCFEDFEHSRIFVYSSLFSTFAISYESSTGYMITFMANGGTGTDHIQEVDPNAATSVTLDANTFSRSGYSFSGWNTKADGSGTSYSNGQSVTVYSDLVLYAQWKQYTVRFNMNGHGTQIASQAIAGGGKVTKPSPDPTAEGYGFGGWFTDAACTNAYDFSKSVSSNFTLYAKWEQFSVSFNMMSHGEEIPAQTVPGGQLLERPDDPVDEAYDFIGWYTEEELENEYDFETPVKADFRLYAKWTIKQHSVSFNMAGKSVENVPETKTVEHGSAAARPAEDPETEGFIFTDWYTEEACENVYDFATPVTEDIELFAGWREAQKFSVSFNMCGKEATDVPESQEVWEGKCAAEPAAEPKAEGFKFAGWYREAECVNHFNFSEPILADTVVYAKWIDAKAERFSVSFNLSGKPGTAPSSQIVEKGGVVTEPAAPEAKGFIFTGWYTEPECVNLYDFGTPVTTDLMLYAGWKEGSAVVIEGGETWNLYEDASVHEFKVNGINVSGTVANSNAKSKAYYDAKISGSTITVSVTGDRRKAAANATLEFDLGKDGVIVYELPVSYVKPVFKLSTNAATIKNGTETVLKTTLLVKNEEGSFEPYDMTDVTVSGNGLGTVTKAADGSIEITTSAAGKGKIAVTKENWDGRKTVSLAYTVKGSKKDVLAVDLQGLKTVVVNSNAKGQTFSFDVRLNGAAPAADALTIADKKNTGLATMSGGKLVIAYRDGVKNGTYTITLQAGEAKTNVKIKVSDKALDKAVTAKVKTKYDVVTRQGMVVVPKLGDLGGTIKAVSVAESGFIAKLNAAGNIVIDYTGNAYDTKNLKIGTLTLTLTINGVDKPVTVVLKNVKAKKTTPKTKVASVTIPADASEAAGKVIGTANIVSSYKDSAGMVKTIRPVKTEIVGTLKGVEAKVNESDLSEIDIYSLSKKSASFKVKLTYAGDVSKTVTVKVKKK